MQVREQSPDRVRKLLERLAMRKLLLILTLVLTACDAPESQLRQVTIESPEALGLSLREVPASALRPLGLRYGLSVVKAGSLGERKLRPARKTGKSGLLRADGSLDDAERRAV
jgi:hypothetical protein